MRRFAKTITYLKIKEGDKSYYNAMVYWYETLNDEKWLNKYAINDDTTEIENVLNKQHKWFREHNFNFTPCLFINEYQYPKKYDLNDIPFFIDELLDDKELRL